MKKVFFGIVALVASIPAYASAHVKWFVDAPVVEAQEHSLTTFYGWGSHEVIVWGLIVLAVVFVFSFIDRVVPSPRGLERYALKHERGIMRVAQVVLGLFLVSVSLLWRIIIVPEYHVSGLFTHILEYAQIALGLMYIGNIKPRVASIGLLALIAIAAFKEGPVMLLENAILISLATYFYIMHSPLDGRCARMRKHAVEIVRIGTGISLIVLAFTEKLLYPELSLNFLSVHHWNFMQPLLPWFTDKLFVLSTGFAEMIFGILFVVGYITRITTVLIAVFFGLSVTTMLTQFHAWEVEDLVVYAAAILFIFFGHGRTKFFHFAWPNSKLHKQILGGK